MHRTTYHPHRPLRQTAPRAGILPFRGWEGGMPVLGVLIPLSPHPYGAQGHKENRSEAVLDWLLS